MFKQPEGKKSATAPEQPAGRPVTGALSFESMFTQIGRVLDLATTAHEEHVAQLHALQERIAESEAQIQDLDGRFTKILEERFKQVAPETPTPDLQLRYDLADAFQRFFTHVDLELSDIYSQVAQTRPTTIQRARWIAELLGYLHSDTDLARIEPELLSGYGPDDAARTRIGQLAERFDELCGQARGLDPDYVLAFEPSAGPMGPDRQRAWKHCDPEGRIEFVVTPAYRVGHRVFLPQQVFTVPWPAERG